MNGSWKRTWAEIDLNKIKHNFYTVKELIPQGTKICCVLKANAYGHGAKKISKLLEDIGADWFAVAIIDEAIELRTCGITRPILILGYTPTNCAEELSKNNITQCVYSLKYAEALSKEANIKNINIDIHIKLDTGMGRLGFDSIERPIDTVDDIIAISKLQGLNITGIFTHFSSADEGEQGREFTRKQFERFINVITEAEALGVSFELKHCSNSAAIIDYPEFSMDMVRAGIILYGLLPSDKIIKDVDLRPSLSLKTVISHIKTVPSDTTISYGREYITTEERKIATLPIGYADGFLRSNSNNGTTLLVNGKFANIVGRICMDQLLIDITDIDGVKEGDAVVIFGDGPVTADTIAKNNNTINYEIICAISDRVKRIYK